MKYDLNWLKNLYDQDVRIKYLFFWGHQPAPDGTITASVFSQWWDGHPFTVDGILYLTAEHWMMAGKARMFGDNAVLQSILNSKSPAEAKKLGRQVQHFDPAVWDREKFDLVKTGNLHKFTQHPDLQDFLKNTGDRVIVEASPVDPVWGIGLAKNDPDIENPAKWKGENLLGFALMEVRDLLVRGITPG